MQGDVIGPLVDGLEAAIRRAGSGDARAMEDVFDLACPRLLELLTTLVADPLVREAVVFRTLVDVWKQSPAADLRHGALPWVTTLALGQARTSRAAASGDPDDGAIAVV